MCLPADAFLRSVCCHCKLRSLRSQALREVFHMPNQLDDVCYFGVDVTSMGVFDRVKGTHQVRASHEYLSLHKTHPC